MEIYGFIIMYYIYWTLDWSLRILYIGQHFLYIVHFGGIHNFVYISIWLFYGYLPRV